MKINMKTSCAILLSTVFIANSQAISTYASYDDYDSNKYFDVYSEDFPEAFILTEYQAGTRSDSRSNDMVSVGEVKATVFVEEAYTFVNDEVITISSRLLNEEEVNSIGIEQFHDINDAINNSRVNAGTANNSYYKCVITMGASYQYAGSGVNWNLYGTGGWSNMDSDYMKGPAAGLDYIGYTWFGDLEFKSPSASLTWSSAPPASMGLIIKEGGSHPNKGYVWSFNEYWQSGNTAARGFVQLADVTLGLSKKVLTGGGNTANAVLTYIHTYDSVSGSITINQAGGGFSLSSSVKQWTISCSLSGLPY